MDAGAYFTFLIHLLSVVTFITLILAFLYLIYSREERAS